MSCFCTKSYCCAECSRRIDAAEDARDYPIFDPRLANDEAERVCGGPHR